jgi:alpha-methylacyl-CoA racemase
MMFADMGADVVRVERVEAVDQPRPDAVARDALSRGRRSIGLDLKHPAGVETLFQLLDHADVLIEGWRPGVAERLGVGPDECLARNPRLVYGRMTGWGQDGPLANEPGHDINYIALAGALAHIGRVGQPPTPPLNLLGDFGGGGMLMVIGVCAALVERATSGLGQVIGAAMVDGAALLMAFFASVPLGARGTNILDSGAAHYDVYECADGKFVSVGPIEPKFHANLCRVLEFDGPEWNDPFEQARWPERTARLAERFRTKTQKEWCDAFDGAQACFAPVLTLHEAAHHPHNVHRGTYVFEHGLMQPAPAPRFSRTPSTIGGPPATPGRDTVDVLQDCGLSATAIGELFEQHIVASADDAADA